MIQQSELIPVAFNGPGMIGRDSTRLAVEQPEIGVSVSAINYRAKSPNEVANLIRNCSIYGPWKGHKVTSDGEDIQIDGKTIKFFAVPEPDKIPWQETDTKIVIDAARINNDPNKAALNIRENGPSRVVIASAPKKTDCPIIINGVNNQIYNPLQDRVVSAGTCSSNALIPVVDVLHKKFGLQGLIAVTTHSLTGENETYDRIKGGTEGKAISNNIVPDKTGASKTLLKVMPQLKDALGDNLFIGCNRVPITHGSQFDIFVTVQKSTTENEVAGVFEEAANDSSSSLNGVLKYTTDSLTAADCRGETYGTIVPAPYIRVFGNGHQIHVTADYDNIRGFDAQMLRTTRDIAEKTF